MAELVHGKASTYQHSGCRCQSCRAAATGAARLARQKPNNRSKEQAAAAERLDALRVLRDRHYAEYREILTALRAGEVVDTLLGAERPIKRGDFGTGVCVCVCRTNHRHSLAVCGRAAVADDLCEACAELTTKNGSRGGDD